MRTTTRNNQTLPDIAVQECGNIEAAFDIARLNGLSLTDELKTGQTLDIACTTACTESVVGKLAADGVKPRHRAFRRVSRPHPTAASDTWALK